VLMLVLSELGFCIFSADKRGEVGRVNLFCSLECMDLTYQKKKKMYGYTGLDIVVCVE
jgi:hypothetical protein